jgi:hypothetical protein
MTRPAALLDRDGTLVEEVPYLHDPERLALQPGVGSWPPRSTRCWRARCPRAEKRPDPLRP